MKKFRGKRRYFKDLKIHRDSFELSFEKDSWFDFWHTHYDWDGLGNNKWKMRRPHLDVLFNHFSLYQEKLQAFEKPFQLFILVNDIDSSQDAIYIHSENPNQANFPFALEENLVCTLKNKQLINYLNSKEKFIKIFGENENEGYCILYKKRVGKEIKQ